MGFANWAWKQNQLAFLLYVTQMITWYKNFLVKHFSRGHVIWLSGNNSDDWVEIIDPACWPLSSNYFDIDYDNIPEYTVVIKQKHIKWIERTFVGEYKIKTPKWWPAESWEKGNIDGLVYAFPIIIALPVDVTSFILRYGDKIIKL